MAKTQHLKGVAALAVAMIVSAVTAGAVLGQDGCEDEECLFEQSLSTLVEAPTTGETAASEDGWSDWVSARRPLSDSEQMADLFASGDLLAENVSLNFMVQMLEAQGLSSEQIEQVMSMYEQMAHLGGGGGAGKVNASGDDVDLVTENVSLNFITEMLEAQGLPEEAIDQLMILGLSGGFGTLTDEEGKAAVINHEEQYVSGAGGGLTLEALEDPTIQDAAAVDPAGTVEAAVAAAAAQRGIDPNMLEQLKLEDILGLLAEE